MILRTSLLTLSILFSLSLIAQNNIEGKWHGIADFGMMKLRIVFDLKQENGELSGKLISPDQDNFEIELSTADYTDQKLKLGVAAIGLTYNGVYQANADNFTGTIEQNGQSAEVNLQREAIESPYKRPQTPKEPYPYYTEDIVITNPVLGHKLSGTLSLPEEDSKVPIAVMITGSGPQDRDETIAHHKPFLVIANHLTRQGFGVFRYDERGVGESTGDYSTATSEDFTRDAIVVLEHLKHMGYETLGVIGHSEGGMVAAKIGAIYPIDFLISMAGTGVSGRAILEKQNLDITVAEGVDPAAAAENNRKFMEMVDIVINSDDLDASRLKLETHIDSVYAAQIAFIPDYENWKEQQIQSVNTIWMKYFLSFDPAQAWEKVSCPALVLNGTKDLQVDKELNFKAIEAALIKAKNEDFTLTPLKDHNHLFQPSTTGRPSEYDEIETTISDQTLKLMTQWLDAHFK